MQQDVLEGFRLSPLQKWLWLLAGDRPDCVCQCVVRIDGEPREAALRAAIEGLCRRHESLRTTFHRLPGMEVPVQVVEPTPAYLLELGPAAGEEDAERLLDRERRRSFDPGRLPLLRLVLCPVAPERHLLVITAAALCADRRSLRNLVQELGMSLADGTAAAEPPGEMVQYIDFSEWQHGVLEDADREDLEFWRRQENGAPPPPELPGERSVAAVTDGEWVRLEAEPWLAERIDAVGGLEQGTVLMAAWYLLLSRLGGGTDLVIDCLVDGRRVSPLARAVGLFEKHVPLRLPVEEDFRFTELVTLVQNAYVTASLNQDGYLPVEPPSGGRLPSRVGFELLDLRHEESNGAVRMHLLDLEARAERFKLRLSAMRTAAGWRLTLASDLGAFDRDVLGRLGERLLTILAAALQSPEARLGDLEILGPAERRRLLEDLCHGAVAYLPATSVQQLFEAQVDRTPEAVAVLSGEQQLSFRELDERANRLAWRLRDLGVGPEERVGLCFGRSVDLVAAVIATLKAGGAFVPMDSQLPRERLAYLARDAGLRVVVTEEGCSAALPEEIARVVLRPTGEDLAGKSGARPAVQVSPESLAYVLYTSGSTGRPKGVLIRHRSVMNLAFALRSSLYEDEGEGLRVSMNAPLSFDASIKQFLQLLWGHSLVLVPEDVRRDGEELLRFVTAKRLDVVDCTPPQLELLLAAGLLDGISSRRFLVGGEAIGEGPWRALAGRSEIAFWNVYGPTECTVDTTVCRIGEVLSPSIGRPLANVRLYVVEPEWRLAPEGSVGELWIGGEGLARGYLGRPELTAERFVPDPFGAGRGERLYRSGDRVRWGRAAALEFVGRLDHQVKIRGVRVELGEIESVLLEHESVSAAAVVQARRGEEQRLVGYVVPRRPQDGQQELEVGALREYLRQRLPEVMVPSPLVALDRLPLTRHGKVDRSALPVPEELERRHGETFAEARTPFEELLAALFAEVLGMDRVGIEESFFDLGGHSLLATRLMSRLREAFRVEMPLRALFDTPTVSALALRIEGALGRGEEGGPAPPLVRVPRDQELPLSFAQQRLWFLDQLTPGSSAYNIPAAILLSGSLDAGALERAFSELVRRHEVLRCRFVQDQGRPLVAITPPGRILLPLVDLTALASPARDVETERLSREAARTPFDLEKGPLWRIRLVRLARGEHLALITMHHAVSDAWSMDVMLREISDLYSAFAAGGPSPLVELPIQYVDFAVWQRRWLQGEVLAAELVQWRQRLADAPPLLELPTDRPRPAQRSERGAMVSFALPAPLWDRLRKVTREAGVTMFMTLLAAFKVLLSRYTGRSDIVVGTPVAGRNRLEIEGLIGFFINTLVLRVDLGGGPPFRALLARVREVALESQAHQDVPFEKLVDELQVERALSHSALFQVLFVLQNAPRGALKLPGLQLSTVASDSGSAKFDLTLSVSETGGRLVGLLGYNCDLFDRMTMERLCGHWTALLEGAAAAPERPVTSLPMLSPAEHQQLREWTEALRRRPGERAVHELFELQAARVPEAVAVVFEGERLLYKDLDRRANQLARYLRRLGVGRGSRVGILLDRRPAMVVAVLAVLKAGAAYVPLPPGQPSERLNYILQDTGAAVVLENSAYILYTSGSTGLPKGVVIEHRQLLWYLDAIASRLGLVVGASCVMLQPLTVDSCKTVLFPPLISGGCLHLISEERALNAEALGEYFQQAGIDCLKIAPSHLSALLAATAEPSRLMPRRWLVIGGEALPWELARSLPVLEGCKVFNHYGPTETTVGITAHRLHAEVLPAHHSATVPLGRPLGDARLSVLDADLQEVAIGVPGELYAGGAAVARGYLHRPALTGERFVPDPLGREAGGRLYRTGDRVRWLPDGSLEFLGRLDHQVKIRGFRIELGEIAAVLEQHPQITEVVVLARHNPEQSPRLVAYFVAEARGAPPESALREYLAARLPDYMLPASLVELRALPRTPHGKVDLQALPQVARPEAELDEEAAPLCNPIEATLASIWAQVLGRERVGIHDNFFRLGGDSIQSIQIVARANAAGLRLTPRQMFEHQTVAELAAVAGSAPAIAAEQGLVTGPVHLTPIQRRFFEIDCPEFHHWNFAALLRVDPQLDGDLLPRVVEVLLRHHDALRLRFVREVDGWRQWIAAPEAEVPFSLLDVSELGPLAREAVEAAAAAAQKSFDLARGPLLRVVRFRLGRGEADRLLVTAHHLVVDAVSWRILLEDKLTVWRQLAARAEPLLPPKTTSFKGWAHRLAEHAATAAVKAELPIWLDSRTRVPPLPRDYASRSNTVGSARILSTTLSAQSTHALLVQVPGVYHTHINDALLAALLQAFAAWTGDRSLLIDLEGHGREEILEGVDVVRTVGWFTTLFPVMLHAERMGDPGSLLKSVKEQLRAIPNRGIGYSLLRYLSPDEGARRSLSELPQAEVSFNYLGQFDGALAQAALLTPAPESRGPTLSPQAARRYLIDVNARIVGGELHLDWTYSETVHREETIESVAQGFHRALEGLISHCLSPVAGGFTPADFPHVDLSQAELDQLLAQMEELEESANE